ncbi:MAG: hypothetical protein ACYTFG_21890 [Planctomycetota bacterium]|jgi:hypothetical protein
MTELPDTYLLGAEEEAARLWKGAKTAQESASEDFIALVEALDLGLRAIEVLVTHRLEPVKDQFPATISIQLDTPSPEVEPHRDAITVPNSLSFTAILDLLSNEELDCVNPGLHRGWEDRRFSCRRSRITAKEVLDVTLDQEERDALLLLSAYRNRIFRSPPPVRVVREEIMAAFPALNRLVESLT